MTIQHALGVIGLCCATAAPVMALAGTPVYVGVLEDIATVHLSPAMAVPHVRVAFEKRGTDWVPLRSDFNTPTALAEAEKYYPDTVDWTVVFDGKDIGTITSRSAGAIKYYGDIGTQTITTAPASIPRITTGASAFWYVDHPAHSRPLVLVSAPNHQDPEGWKPAQLTAAEKSTAISDFRTRFPSLEHCDEPEQKPIHMIPYADSEVVILKAYRSRDGEVMFGEQLSDKRSNCGFFDDEHFFDYWFVMDRHQQLRLLGSEMSPMDAVDLDADGKSEWVFQVNRGEDENGYRLFYGDFGSSAYFGWKYH